LGKEGVELAGKGAETEGAEKFESGSPGGGNGAGEGGRAVGGGIGVNVVMQVRAREGRFKGRAPSIRLKVDILGTEMIEGHQVEPPL
jgi:hypothetical protein